MPNVVKYSIDARSNTLKKGNVLLGINSVEYGPTSATGFWNGIEVPAGGYAMYIPSSNGNGMSIYSIANDTQLIKIVNEIGLQSFTTAAEALVWTGQQTGLFLVNREYENIVTNGLVTNLDAGFTPSYPKSGTTWSDLAGSNNGTLTNGPTFNSTDGGILDFDGTDDYISIVNNIGYWGTQDTSFECWVKPKSEGTLYGLQYFGKGSSCVRAEFGLEYGRRGLSGNKKFSILIHGSNFYYLQTTNEFEPNNWYHHVGTRYYNGTNYEVKIYINSVLEVSGSTQITSDTNGSLNIGGGVAVCGAVGTANVNIGIGRIYNRALTASEVLQNYNAQKGRFGL